MIDGSSQSGTHASQVADQLRRPGDRHVVGAGHVRGLGVHLGPVLRAAGDIRGRLAGGDRAAAPACPGLHLVFGHPRRRGRVMSNTCSFCVPRQIRAGKVRAVPGAGRRGAHDRLAGIGDLPQRG